jgi:L-asparaginase/Glu-tRNA(Gln) amidotransferase subunit D
LVLTGGTIGAEEDNLVLSVGGDPTGAEAGLLERMWPGPGEPSVTVASPLRKLSESVEPSDWLKIASAVRRLVVEADATGVVILHGTDTMGYTAAALSFLLSDLDRPVVLTGSNLPSGEEGSDADDNVHAALVALKALDAGVYAAFAGGQGLPGQVYLGTRIRKVRASGGAFESVNRDVVGVVEDGHFRAKEPHAARKHDGCVQRIDDRVLALRLYPGLDLDLAFQSVVAGDIRGVVIELYASATGPDTGDRFSLPRFIEKCVSRGVVVATAVPEAPAKTGKTYETTLAVGKAGGIFLGDMTPETATVKLMWALAQSPDEDLVRELMLRPIAGELGGARSPPRRNG